MLRKFLNIAISALLLTLFLSCGVASSDYPSFPKPTGPSAGTWEYPDNSGTVTGPNNKRTGNEGTWYQIFTGSFYSSTGKAKDNVVVGDIKGIMSKLDYLNDGCKDFDCNKSLHIDGIWLTPIMPSPSYHKYDTTDYMKVDPDFGSINDVKVLVAECHKRGIKLIVDLAVNHTSPEHPWFKNALKELNEAETGQCTGQYYDYYNFHTNPDKNADRWWAFQDISNHWYRPDEVGQSPGQTKSGDWIFYYGAFGKEMPDLNWDNKKVKKEFEDIIKFWLVDVGIDGWRLDATKHIFEVAEWTGDTEKNIAFWTWFAQTCRKYKPDAYMVGECLDSPETILEYHRPGMSSFALFMAQGDGRIANAALMNVNDQKGNGALFSDGVLWYTREVKYKNPLATFSPFISNHDFDRSSKYLTLDQQRKMAGALLLLTPGTPFIYYGEEIGLLGWKQDSDKWVRGPMIFSFDKDHPADGPSTIGRPTPPDNWSLVNDERHGQPAWAERGGVEEQLKIEDSLLRYYIKVGNLKRKYPWISWGRTDDTGITRDNDGQIAAFRVTDDDPKSASYGKSVVIAHNTSGEERYAANRQDWRSGYIKVPNAQGYEAISAHGSSSPVKPDSNDSQGRAFWIEPYATVIFREYSE